MASMKRAHSAEECQVWVQLSEREAGVEPGGARPDWMRMRFRKAVRGARGRLIVTPSCGVAYGARCLLMTSTRRGPLKLPMCTSR